jgi:coniferyl-aldehyde dehydrogenase
MTSSLPVSDGAVVLGRDGPAIAELHAAFSAPYDEIEQALYIINAGDRPLGLYVFGDNHPLLERILGETTSGGAAINACAIQGALPSLPFGGVGMSGMGRHHGIEGFREFSNPRGVVVRGTGDIIDAFYPPQSKAASVVQAALSSAS